MHNVALLSTVLFSALAVTSPAPPPVSWSVGHASARSVPVNNLLELDLRIQQLTRGGNRTLVSSGIPVKSGVLRNDHLPRLRIEIDGQEVPAYVEALAHWPDGTLRSVLVQFEWTGTSRSDVRLVVGSERAAAPRRGVAPPTGLPGAVALPRQVQYLVGTALMGATVPQSMTRTLGSAFGKYEPEFKRLADRHWASHGDAWEENYYDRSLIYYIAWIRSGDPEYWLRATKMALSYRQHYLERNTYKSSPHWSLLGGLELHYLLTGDTLSRRAVAGVFAWGLSSFANAAPRTNPALDNPLSEYMDNRIQARVLQGALSAYRLNASFTRSDGLAFPAGNWPTTLRGLLNKILSVQLSDGSYAWAQICGGQLNYMVGLLNDVLIEYYRDFEADPRIPVAVARANEYLWTRQWLPNQQAFKYASVNCAPNPFGMNVGGMTPAGDLNGLMVASFGWLYQQTGDPKWRARGDAIFAGMFAPRWLASYAGSKQFNQAFASSYRYLGYRMSRP